MRVVLEKDGRKKQISLFDLATGEFPKSYIIYSDQGEPIKWAHDVKISIEPIYAGGYLDESSRGIS
jgi:DUF2075 family protein